MDSPDSASRCRRWSRHRGRRDAEVRARLIPASHPRRAMRVKRRSPIALRATARNRRGTNDSRRPRATGTSPRRACAVSQFDPRGTSGIRASNDRPTAGPRREARGFPPRRSAQTPIDSNSNPLGREAFASSAPSNVSRSIKARVLASRGTELQCSSPCSSSRSGPSGVCTNSTQRANAEIVRPPLLRVASKCARIRDFPTPASPEMSTMRPWPPAASRRNDPSSVRSRSRATSSPRKSAAAALRANGTGIQRKNATKRQRKKRGFPICVLYSRSRQAIPAPTRREPQPLRLGARLVCHV